VHFLPVHIVTLLILAAHLVGGQTALQRESCPKKKQIKRIIKPSRSTVEIQLNQLGRSSICPQFAKTYYRTGCFFFVVRRSLLIENTQQVRLFQVENRISANKG